MFERAIFNNGPTKTLRRGVCDYRTAGRKSTLRLNKQRLVNIDYQRTVLNHHSPMLCSVFPEGRCSSCLWRIAFWSKQALRRGRCREFGSCQREVWLLCYNCSSSLLGGCFKRPLHRCSRRLLLWIQVDEWYEMPEINEADPWISGMMCRLLAAMPICSATTRPVRMSCVWHCFQEVRLRVESDHEPAIGRLCSHSWTVRFLQAI